METIKKLLVRVDVLIAVWMTVGLVAIGIQLDLNKSEWASWVQAFGSIAALAVAIFIMSNQSKAAIRLAAQTDRAAVIRRTAAVAGLMHNCHRSVHAAMTQLEGKLQGLSDVRFILAASTPWSEMLEGARGSLAAVPLHELGTVNLVMSSIGMLECTLFLNNTLADWRNSGIEAFDVEQAKKIAEEYKTQADTLMDMFHIERIKLGNA